MRKRVQADIEQGDTERKKLIDIAADHAAGFYYQLKYPQVYRSVRYIQGHPVVVIMMDGSKQIDEQLQSMELSNG